MVTRILGSNSILGANKTPRSLTNLVSGDGDPRDLRALAQADLRAYSRCLGLLRQAHPLPQAKAAPAHIRRLK
jgi:hypothetical protein